MEFDFQGTPNEIWDVLHNVFFYAENINERGANTILELDAT